MTDTVKQMMEKHLQAISEQIAVLEADRTATKKAINFLNLQEETLMAQGGVKEPTFKEKVKEALNEKYHDGASALQLLEYINTKWTTQVIRSSLSPQLSRLKKEDVLDLKDGIWVLKDKKEPPEGGSDFI